MANKWPAANQAALIAFYGMPGTSAVSSKLVKVIPPFRMTYDGKALTHLMFHKLAAPALERALKTVWDYYGHDQAKIDKLGISKTAGTYNPRKIAGSNNWSNHAFAAAIDINAAENGFNMAGNIPIPMVCAFKAEGARWGGNYKGGRTDPMHFEFCESGEAVRTFEQWLQMYGVKTGPTSPVQPVTPAPIVKNTYDEALRRLLAHEGGYSNDPVDAGGPTNFGITIHDFRKYIKANGTANDVKNMTVDQAKTIYRIRYWAAMNCDDLPAGVDYAVFDYGVNSGIGRAPNVLQRIVGVNDDGDIGPITLTAVRKRDPKELINAICDERMTYLQGRANWWKYKGGWTIRVKEVRAVALAMASAGSIVAPPLARMGSTLTEVQPLAPPGWWEGREVPTATPPGWWASLKSLFK